jgi:hypothetical protein
VIVFDRKAKRDDTVVILSTVSMCQQFNVLPRSGGLLEQNQIDVRHMQLVLEQQAERQKKDEQEREAERKRQASKSKRGG